MRKKIVILGAGGFAREVAWLIDEINHDSDKWELLGYIDESIENHNNNLNGYPVLGDFTWFDQIEEEVYAVCAVGDTAAKKRLCTRAEEMGVLFATLIHPKVMMAPFVDVGEGTIICAGNIITTNISIGRHVIINLDCTIGHDVVIEDYCTVLPGVHISGNVRLCKGVNFGTGGAVIQGKIIGENVTVGAGAVVVSDLPPQCTAVGVPAKPMSFSDRL